MHEPPSLTHSVPKKNSLYLQRNMRKPYRDISHSNQKITVKVAPLEGKLPDGFSPLLKGKSDNVNSMISKMMKKLNTSNNINLEFDRDTDLENFKQ